MVFETRYKGWKQVALEKEVKDLLKRREKALMEKKVAELSAELLKYEDDEEKTSFITDRGIYCYKVMPFGLKNAGATYQRLVNSMFKSQIGRNVEVYVDDMLTKSAKKADHVKDLAETFAVLNEYGMKLNPSKCAFGVASGKFLGFMVSERGIEANPEKI